MAQLSDLSAELIDSIAKELSLHDICAVRLTCSALRAYSFHQFSTRYFTEVGVAPSSAKDLQKLVDISRHEHLRSIPKSLVVKVEAFSDSLLRLYGDYSASSSSKDIKYQIYFRSVQERLKKYNGGFEELQDELEYTLRLTEVTRIQSSRADRQQLTIALRGLRNIRSVVFCPVSVRVGELKLGPDVLQDYRNTRRWASHCLFVTLHAVADAGLRLDRLVAWGGYSAMDITLPDFEESAVPREELGQALASLQTLALTVELNPSNSARLDILSRFLTLVPAVQKLSLTHHESRRDARVLRLVNAIYPNSQIVEFSLANTKFDVGEAKQFLWAQRATLRKLHLTSSYLQGTVFQLFSYILQLQDLTELIIAGFWHGPGGGPLYFVDPAYAESAQFNVPYKATGRADNAVDDENVGPAFEGIKLERYDKEGGRNEEVIAYINMNDLYCLENGRRLIRTVKFEGDDVAAKFEAILRNGFYVWED